MAVPPYERDPLKLVYVQVAEHLALRIRAGEWAPGSMITRERDLAVEYGTAYVTLRRSIEILRNDGLIVTLPGHGNFVARGDAG